MLEIADHGDGESVDGTDLFADGEDVEQRLRRVLTRSVAGVDKRTTRSKSRSL